MALQPYSKFKYWSFSVFLLLWLTPLLTWSTRLCQHHNVFWSILSWPSLIDRPSPTPSTPFILLLVFLRLVVGWPHSSHAYFQLPGNQEEMLFRGGAWWKRGQGEVCIVQEQMAHEYSCTEGRWWGARFQVQLSLNNSIVPLLSVWLN